jgi:hypothetical protein
MAPEVHVAYPKASGLKKRVQGPQDFICHMLKNQKLSHRENSSRLNSKPQILPPEKWEKKPLEETKDQE